MTKDRLSEMVQLMRVENMAVETCEAIPEKTSESITSFLEQVQCCREKIQSIKDQIRTLQRYHNEIQRCTDDNTRKELEYKVEEKKTTITSSILAIRNHVKSIQDIFTNQKISPALKRMKEVQLNSLIRSLNDVTEEYYSCLVDHSEKCKKLLYEMLSIAGDDKSDADELIEKGKIAFFTNNLLLNELEQKINFRDVEDKHADILKVEKSIMELKDLTQHLSLIVAEQGEKVEYVEKYVQKTSQKVDDAAKVMKKAEKLRNKSRKRKLCISLLCGIVIIVVLVIIVCI